MRPAAAPVALLGALLMTLVSSCAPFGLGEGPQQVLDAFTQSVAKGKVPDALFVGQDAAAYDRVVSGMTADPIVSWADATTKDDRASATLTWHWTVSGSTWVYRSTAKMVKVAGKGESNQWQIEYQPSLVEPSLQAGERLVEQSVQPPRADILGADDAPIVSERPVVRVGLDKTRLPADNPLILARVATKLARTVDIDVNDYVELAKKMGPNAFVPAIVYRKAEVPPEVTALAAQTPAVLTIADQLSLASSKEFAAPLLGSVGAATAELVQNSGGRIAPGDLTGTSGLQLRYDEQLAGTDGTTVLAKSKSGQRVLFSIDPVVGQPLRTTLDPKLQQEADQLLSRVGPPSAMVAIKPSTGALLAVANGPGTDGQNIATYGRYAPGSTFKMVTALALLRAGFEPSSRVHCDESISVDGKEFANYPDYPASALGAITLTEAIAHSCNTAMISAGDKLSKGALAQAAASLGFGVDHDLGFPAYFGEVPKPQSQTQAAADLIGQGQISASPMAIAVVMASIIKGHTVVPQLIEDQTPVKDPSAGPTKALTESAQLSQMLRAVVTQGSGAGLRGLPGPEVIAKTGTAQYGDHAPYPTHASMVAGQGDLAVAVFVGTGESGSQTAGPLLKRFLTTAHNQVSG